MKKLPLIILAATISIYSVSCKKDDAEKQNLDQQATTDNDQAEYISNDAITKADAATKGQSSFKLSSDPLALCATVTRDTAGTGVHTITVDFGTTNCVSADGRSRRGKIIMTYSGNYYATGSVRTITFDNYYVNDHKVEGTHTVTANGRVASANNHYTWTINAQNMKVTRTDGKYHTWSSTRTRELALGDSTLFNVFDDTYWITGSSNGTNINGLSYTVTINTPLVVSLDCRYIKSGNVTLTPSGISPRTVDFGTGACDNNATVSVNGMSYPFVLQ